MSLGACSTTRTRALHYVYCTLTPCLPGLKIRARLWNEAPKALRNTEAASKVLASKGNKYAERRERAGAVVSYCATHINDVKQALHIHRVVCSAVLLFYLTFVSSSAPRSYPSRLTRRMGRRQFVCNSVVPAATRSASQVTSSTQALGDHE